MTSFFSFRENWKSLNSIIKLIIIDNIDIHIKKVLIPKNPYVVNKLATIKGLIVRERFKATELMPYAVPKIFISVINLGIRGHREAPNVAYANPDKTRENTGFVYKYPKITWTKSNKQPDIGKNIERIKGLILNNLSKIKPIIGEPKAIIISGIDIKNPDSVGVLLYFFCKISDKMLLNGFTAHKNIIIWIQINQKLKGKLRIFLNLNLFSWDFSCFIYFIFFNIILDIRL